MRGGGREGREGGRRRRIAGSSMQSIKIYGRRLNVNAREDLREEEKMGKEQEGEGGRGFTSRFIYVLSGRAKVVAQIVEKRTAGFGRKLLRLRR